MLREFIHYLSSIRIVRVPAEFLAMLIWWKGGKPWAAGLGLGVAAIIFDLAAAWLGM